MHTYIHVYMTIHGIMLYHIMLYHVRLHAPVAEAPQQLLAPEVPDADVWVAAPGQQLRLVLQPVRAQRGVLPPGQRLERADHRRVVVLAAPAPADVHGAVVAGAAKEAVVRTPATARRLVD